MKEQRFSTEELRQVPHVEVLDGLAHTLPLAIGQTVVVGSSKIARRDKRTLVVTPEQEFLSLAQAAVALGLGSAAGLRVQVHRGALRATLMGGRWFVTRDEVERYKRDSLGKHGRKPYQPPHD